MMADTPTSTSNASNGPSTELVKHPKNSNWGGQRAGSGRKRLKLPTTTSSSQTNETPQPAPSHTRRTDQPNAASTFLPLTKPADGFFAPRVPNNPTALHTAGYTDPDVPMESQALLGSMLGHNGMEFNGSGDILHSDHGKYVLFGSNAVYINFFIVDEHPGLHLSMAQYSQLREELTFVQEHDENADIATGMHVIDNSLSDEILDTPEDSAATAEAETASAEVQTESAVHQHLQAVLNDIKKQITHHHQPDCYRRGDFFYRSKHPVFALHDARINGVQPDRLCARDVFVWLPSCLPGAPDHFKCDCGLHLTKNGESQLF